MDDEMQREQQAHFTGTQVPSPSSVARCGRCAVEPLRVHTINKQSTNNQLLFLAPESGLSVEEGTRHSTSAGRVRVCARFFPPKISRFRTASARRTSDGRSAMPRGLSRRASAEREFRRASQDGTLLEAEHLADLAVVWDSDEDSSRDYEEEERARFTLAKFGNPLLKLVVGQEERCTREVIVAFQDTRYFSAWRGQLWSAECIIGI